LADNTSGRVITMLLLAPDTVDLHGPSSTEDKYGWAQPDDGVVWTGQGNLQLAGGTSDPRAAEGGGGGPYQPRYNSLGQLYLPADAPVTEGAIADVGSKQYVLSQTRIVADPVNLGLDCWVCTVTEVTSWEQ
jgi:hypothetical protein